MDSKDKRAIDLQNLIQSIIRSPSEPVVEELLKHSLRILNSFLGASSQQDFAVVKQRALDKTSKLYPNDTKTTVRMQELLHKVSRSRTLTRKAEAVKLLLKLADLNPGAPQNFDSLFKSKVINTHQTQATRITESNFSESMYSNVRRPLPDQLLSIRNRGSIEQNITQTDILREVMFVMQNITGGNIVVDKDFFSLKPSLSISQPVRRIVREMCEIGWLFKKVTGKIEEEGTIRDALNTAIKEEINEYYRWLALIQNLIKNEQLTLRKLVLWSFQPFERMKWIATVNEATGPFHGCKIISILNSYRPQGNEAINELLNRLLMHAINPLMNFIDCWINKGELLDDHAEFFIYVDAVVPNERMWQDKYKMIWNMIPNLIDQESALMIYNTGKTLNFLRQCCNYDYKNNVEFIDYKRLIGKGDTNSTFPDEFKQYLKIVSDAAHKQLMDVLFHKFRLKMHLDAVKRFLLMGQGDFIHTLMESVFYELDKQVPMISKNNLVQALQTALRTSNAQFLESDVTGHVSVRFLEQGSDGWDIFSLDYNIDTPIKTLLNPDAMRSYLRIFNMLWRIKKVDYSLNKVWFGHTKQAKRTKESKGIFHTCFLLRYAMMHFITNVYNYVMVTIESAWVKFINDLDKAANFDEVIQMHEKLLTQLLDITFLSLRTRNINTSLFNVFQVIYRFKISQDKLTNDFSDYMERMRTYNQRKKISRTIVSEDMPMPVFETDALKKIKDLKDSYDKSFRQFCNLIKKEEDKLTFLNFRLDFSEYYEFLFVRKNFVE